MLAAFSFAIHITAPIFIILALGIAFKRIGMITDDFARLGSDLVFKVTLPCLLFVKIVETDFLHSLPFKLIAYALVATVLIFLLLDRLLAPAIKQPSDRGVFVQGAYRTSLGSILSSTLGVFLLRSLGLI